MELHRESHHESSKKSHETDNHRTISFNLPKVTLPSIQSVILILLIVVGSLQTIQLFGLGQQIASAKINSTTTTTSASTSSSSSGSVTSSLPSMVGGC